MDLRELLDVAKEELKEMSTLENPDFRLEQARFSEDDNIWEIVVSYVVEEANVEHSPLLALSRLKHHRIYKRLVIDENKKVIGFFMYENQ